MRAVAGAVRDPHAEMRAAAGDRNVWVVGGGLLTQFLDAGLVDDLLLTVVPVVLGAGVPLSRRPGCALTGTRELGGGLVELRYVLPTPSSADGVNPRVLAIQADRLYLR